MIINLLTEKIIKEVNRRAPDTKISMVIMNKTLKGIWENLHTEFEGRIEEEVQLLFSDKQVILSGESLEFTEREKNV